MTHHQILRTRISYKKYAIDMFKYILSEFVQSQMLTLSVWLCLLISGSNVALQT